MELYVPWVTTPSWRQIPLYREWVKERLIKIKNLVNFADYLLVIHLSLLAGGEKCYIPPC